MTSETCRCQPCQERVSLWSRPSSFLASGKNPCDLHCGADAQEAVKEQCNALLYFTVRVLGDDARRVADKAGRQLQRQLAAFRFRQQACRKPPADGVQFEFRDRALQPEQEATIWSAGIINAIAIGDETSTVTADVEQRVPIGAIARQPCDFNR